MSNTAEDQAWRRANRIANGRCGRCNELRAFGTTLCKHHLAHQMDWKTKRRQSRQVAALARDWDGV